MERICMYTFYWGIHSFSHSRCHQMMLPWTLHSTTLGENFVPIGMRQVLLNVSCVGVPTFEAIASRLEAIALGLEHSFDRPAQTRASPRGPKFCRLAFCSMSKPVAWSPQLPKSKREIRFTGCAWKQIIERRDELSSRPESTS